MDTTSCEYLYRYRYGHLIANIVVYLQYSGIGTTLKSIHTLMMVGRKLGNIPHLPTYFNFAIFDTLFFIEQCSTTSIPCRFLMDWGGGAPDLPMHWILMLPSSHALHIYHHTTLFWVVYTCNILTCVAAKLDCFTSELSKDSPTTVSVRGVISLCTWLEAGRLPTWGVPPRCLVVVAI